VVKKVSFAKKAVTPAQAALTPNVAKQNLNNKGADPKGQHLCLKFNEEIVLI
jgi:hypothetical protein